VAGDNGDFDEERDGVADFVLTGRNLEGANDAEGIEVGGEFGPGGEAVFAGEDELGVGEGEAGELPRELAGVEVAETRVAVHAFEGGGIALDAGAE
jgi:hypothetical protein